MSVGLQVLIEGWSSMLQRYLQALWLLPISLMVATSALASGACLQSTIRSGDPLAPDNKFLDPFSCRSAGEIFVASDPLIDAITVWRSAKRNNDATPWQLFITGTQIINSADYPDFHHILLTSPLLVNEFGDGVHPVPFRFAFDPPLALPSSGKYFFCIKETTGFTDLPIVADTTDSYPDGQAWRIGAGFACGGFGSSEPYFPPTTDLVFMIEFCAAATPAQPHSWGELKVRYH
jgi:hypothetical protein